MKRATDERSGVTPEGTRWATRPWTDEITARYTCTRQGGSLSCTNVDADFLCAKHQGGEAECNGNPNPFPDTHYVHPRARCESLYTFSNKNKGKSYSPATPKETRTSALPASVGADFAAACVVAVRRLHGDESWPPDPWKKPTLSAIARGMSDPAFARLYREFCEAVVRAGGRLTLPLGTRKRSAIVKRKAVVTRHWTDGLSDDLKRTYLGHA